MTESHIRVKCTAIRTAIQQLDCSTLKVLMYLSSRTDSRGVCFPATRTIESDCDLSDNCVYKALKELVMYGYIQYLQKAYHDRISGKSSSAVYQVSPHFMEISDEKILEALALWARDFQNPIFLESNQQQEAVPENNDSIQFQKTTTTTNSDSDEKLPTAKSEKPKQQREQTNSVPQPKSESSAIVKNYTNPILISQPLPDLNEQLAESLSTIQIKIIMARGFIAQYGYDLCNMAYKHLQHIQQNQTIDNPAGFYRYLLQSNMANVLPTITKKPHIADDIDLDTFYDS